MSEFKYACPVCGQHIKCDTSQAGTVMDCPTCFQKITVPQPPAGADQKFILTGSQPTEKKIPSMLAGLGGKTAAPKTGLSAALVLILLLAAGASAYFFGGKWLHRQSDWQSGDIGNVGAPGSFSQAKGTWTIAGDGADIWGQADAFRYVYQAASGDLTLTVRAAAMQDTDPWAKAGLMIRESLDPNSAFALVFVSPASGVGFQQRTIAGSPASAVSQIPNLKTPCWLRLTRHGNQFAAETSADGVSWTTLDSTTLAMADPVYAGLAVCSHKNGTLCRATFDNFSLNGSGPTPKPAGKPAPPKPVAPAANDTNWTFDLDAATIPGAPVAGRIHGRDFLIERAGLSNGTLTLRSGTRGPVEFGVTINFEGAQPASLAGKTINVSTNAEKAARVTLRWPENGPAAKASFDSGYALRLEFGKLANHRLPGKIYLCTPDAEKSYLLGSFTANVAKPKPKAPPKR